MTDHVKIYCVKPRIQYTADGTSTEYEFPFAIFKTSDINVYLGDVKQNTSTYTVSGLRNSDGGAIIFETAPLSGTIITIVRDLSIERTSDFQEGGALRADTLNDELDYQIACQQQIAENLNRSMVLPPYAADSDLDLTLPTPSAGKAIVWNSTGTNLENSTVAVNDLESTLNSYKTAAQAAATTATNKANTATTQAQTATTQASIATTKATEATSAANQMNGMRTNCITEIPQDIKLELSNGTLTLKAGSKVYVPNGSGVFNTITITSDKTVTRTDSADCMVWYTANGGINIFPKALFFSGTIAPTTHTYMYWYDTTNNVCKVTTDNGTTWITGQSLPLCIVGTNGTQISEIKQVFNGFGYVGQTMFVLPGIKGLMPNGRNDDGTLRNINYTTNTVSVCEGSTTEKEIPFFIKSDGSLVVSNSLSYNETNNLVDVGGYCQAGTLNRYLGTIQLLSPKTTFQALDRNDKLMLASWAMPDYTAGVSVSTGYVTDYPCFVHISPIWNGNNADLSSPFSQSLAKNNYNGSSKFENSVCFICDAGETISFTNASCYVYPLKGV